MKPAPRKPLRLWRVVFSTRPDHRLVGVVNVGARDTRRAVRVAVRATGIDPNRSLCASLLPLATITASRRRLRKFRDAVKRRRRLRARFT
jgi:hypothetical protein